jgi:hypothetical protein
MMMRPVDIDNLIELSVAEAELQEGLPAQWIAANHHLGGPMLARGSPQPAATRSPRWTEAEDEFLREKLGWLSLDEIAAHLGRSPNGVKLRYQRELHLPAPSKHPDWLTGHTVARVLGVDGHNVVKLVDRGHLPGRLLPGERMMRVVHRVTLYRWAVNPMHWIFFKPSVDDPGRIRDPHLRRLIQRQKERWDDEWWRSGEVAAYHGVDHTDVNRYIHAGKLRGVKWGNWWVLRSEATKPGLVFYKGKGAAQCFRDWDGEGDAFVILARAVGLSWIAIGKLMCGRSGPQMAHRVGWLYRQGQIPDLIGKYGLEIAYDPATGELFADWRLYRHRFPWLDTAVQNFQRRCPKSGDQLHAVWMLLGWWATRYAADKEQQQMAFNLSSANNASITYVQNAYRQLRCWGIDPLGVAQ